MKPNTLCSIIIGRIVIALLLNPAALAETIRIPADYPTIQAGIDAAATSDVILVATGTYQGNGNINLAIAGKALTLMVEPEGAQCTLQCDAGTRGFIIENQTEDWVTVRGFTVKSASLENQSGAGFSIDSAQVRIIDCSVEDNIIYGAEIAGAGVYCHNAILEIINSLFTRNAILSYQASGCGLYGYNSMITIINTTFVGNGLDGYGVIGGALALEGPNAECLALNSIFYANSASEGHELAVLPGATLSISYSTVQGGEAELYLAPDASLAWLEGVITANPLLVQGVLGDFYLAQTQTGHPQTSPCCDAGNEQASLVCYDLLGQPQCLDSLTTRIDHQVDAEVVDMGYHYPPLPVVTPTASPAPTNTPIATVTPLPSPEPTCTCQPSPTGLPSLTPTSTPAPTEPTASPTPEAATPGPSVTPPCTQTPLVTATPAGTGTPIMDLVISGAEFTAGDMFELVAVVTNPGPVQYHNQPLAVVLDVLGTFFFYPSWTINAEYEIIEVPLGINAYPILSFQWPEGAGSSNNLCFFAALIAPSMESLVSSLDMVCFDYY